MAKTEMIRARVEPELKSQAEEVFSGLGLSPTAAITLFYRQVTLHHGLPFAVKVPNAETIAALRQGPHRRGDSPNTPAWRISKPGTVDPQCALLTTKRFEKDLKRGRKRGKDLDKLWSVVERLLSNQPLDPRHRKHRFDRGLVALLGMSHRAGLAVGLGPGGRCSHPGSGLEPIPILFD